MSRKAALDEVTRAVLAVKPQIPKGHSEAYIGGGQSSLTYHGLKVPQVRAIAKQGFSFLDKDPAQVLATWDFVWKRADIYEAMLIAVSYYGSKRQLDGLRESWPVLKTWAEKLDNWALSDCLSSIYAIILEQDRKLVLPTLEEWSGSKHPWLRRQSLVSLIYYANSRQKILPFRTLIAMVKRQLADDDYYVQKGVGWTLRETYNEYPDDTWKFLEKHGAEIKAPAFQAASEKLPLKKKAILKEMRRAARRKD